MLGCVAAAHPAAIMLLVERLVSERLAQARGSGDLPGSSLGGAGAAAGSLGADSTMCALLALAARSATFAEVRHPGAGAGASTPMLMHALLASVWSFAQKLNGTDMARSCPLATSPLWQD